MKTHANADCHIAKQQCYLQAGRFPRLASQGTLKKMRVDGDADAAEEAAAPPQSNDDRSHRVLHALM